MLGQVAEACGDLAVAEVSFRRSLAVLEAIQSCPELAQTLLAYGRFKLADDRTVGEPLIRQALQLFEGMAATGWIAEARATLASPAEAPP